MAYRFSAEQRLLTAEHYERVFKGNKRLFGRFLIIYRLKNGKGFPRLGVITSRRSVAKAVARNRIRRVTKEVFRLHQYALSKQDIVVIAKHRAAKASKSELRECLNQLLTRLEA